MAKSPQPPSTDVADFEGFAEYFEDLAGIVEYLEDLADIVNVSDVGRVEFLKKISKWWRVVTVQYLPDAEATPTPADLTSEIEAVAQAATALSESVSGLSSDAQLYLATMAVPIYRHPANRKSGDQEVKLGFLGPADTGRLIETMRTGARTLAELSTMAVEKTQQAPHGHKRLDSIIEARRDAIRDLGEIYIKFTGEAPTSTPEGKFFLFAVNALKPIFGEKRAQSIDSDLRKVVREFRARVPQK